MKKFVFVLVAFLISIPVCIRDGQVLPVCTVQEKNIDSELEDYVVGVVAGEMPVNFPYEALKAQAVASRTYAVRQLKAGAEYSNISQNYITMDKMKTMWGDNFQYNYNKVKECVNSTAGEILEYNDEPILAVFSSTTNGHTEESGNVWSQNLPYLKSVVSEGDENSPYYNDEKYISLSNFKSLFGSTSIGNIERTENGYVKTIFIGKNSYTGAEIRNMLDLRSTAFEISFDKDNVIIKTKGYGHCVGMSQYGACYMANQGKSYRDILKHYYTGTEIALT